MEDDTAANRALISVLDEFTQQQTTLTVDEVTYTRVTTRQTGPE